MGHGERPTRAEDRALVLLRNKATSSNSQACAVSGSFGAFFWEVGTTGTPQDMLGTARQDDELQYGSVMPDRGGSIDLSVIIVSFNTRDMTLSCLRSIRAETRDVNYEIIVVDNHSEDGSAAAIMAEFPEVRLIALTQNIGFARANNLAADEARGQRILLLNSDTVVLDRAIDRLLKFANETPSCRIWGGRTLFGDRTLNPFSCWREMSLWSLACFTFGLSHFAPNSPIFSPESYGGWDRGSVRYVDIISGCLFLVDHQLWNALRGFDPTYYMYGEEADLCLRARQFGARPVVTPTATIIHYGGASAISSAERRFTLFLGKATLLNRHWSPLRRRWGRRVFVLAPLLRWWAYRIAFQVIKRPDLEGLAVHWRTLWRRRFEWINGYAAEAVRGQNSTA
jgi:GT2 family glycosyltransferase